jgi:hypothetical protein
MWEMVVAGPMSAVRLIAWLATAYIPSGKTVPQRFAV